MPPKPNSEQIAAVRQQVHENVPSVSPFPAIAPLALARTSSVKETAADALARIGPAAIPVLTEALSDPDPEVRMQTANALARMGPPAKEAVPKLIVALGDSRREVRRAAARALGQIGAAATDAIPALIEVIRDPNSDKPSNDEAGKDQS